MQYEVYYFRVLVYTSLGPASDIMSKMSRARAKDMNAMMLEHLKQPARLEHADPSVVDDFSISMLRPDEFDVMRHYIVRPPPAPLE